ncbi:MAG: hypothetical protein JSV44_11670 [Candidatus Zixiibacteriota bacterium]|nr:MAG: hypothetical protein JSV44_11670 [candidate division Zixibacteria bacterium]
MRASSTHYNPLSVTVVLCVILMALPWNSLAGEDIKGSLNIPDADNTQVVTMNDGSQLVGRITEVGDAEVKFRTGLGEMTLLITQIQEIKEVPQSSFRGGKYWFPNSNSSRLFFGPTGRTIGAGQGYFSAIYALFPSIAYGITDNISISGGVSLIPFIDFEDQIFFAIPKVGFSFSDELALAASALVIRVPSDDDDDPSVVGVLFGTGTYGSTDKSLTLGVGYGFKEDEVADKPAVLVGGELRFARRLALVTENWVFPGLDEPLVSYGMRFFGESLAADLAFFTILDEDSIFPGIPYVDFVWNF